MRNTMTHFFIQLPGCCLFSLVLANYWYMRILVVWNSPVSLRKVKKNYMLCKSMPRIRGLVWNSSKSVYFSICETKFCLKPDATILLQSISFQMEESTLKLDVSLSTVILKDGSGYEPHWNLPPVRREERNPVNEGQKEMACSFS